MLSIILIPWRGQTPKTSAFQNSLRRFVFLYPLGNQLIVSPTYHNNFFKKVKINSFISKASHFSVCVIDCCPPRAEVFEKNVFRRLEHQILVVDGIVRIQAVVGSVWKRRTNWVHIKYLKTSLTHSPGGVSVVQLNPLEGVNLKERISKLSDNASWQFHSTDHFLSVITLYRPTFFRRKQHNGQTSEHVWELKRLRRGQKLSLKLKIIENPVIHTVLKTCSFLVKLWVKGINRITVTE